MTTKRRGVDDKTGVSATPSQLPRLYMRRGGRIVEALPEDVDVARRYPTFSSKGLVLAGRRITIMCPKTVYHVGEEVRVIHVLEVLEPGQDIFVMGPKTISGEYVDGCAVAAATSGDALAYDGRVLKSPGVDYNYDITAYRFDVPGKHTIHWQMGELRSNTLELEIVTHQRA